MDSRIIPIIKAETLIPKGLYCYTPVRTPEAEADWKNHGIFRTKCCPFWERYNEEIHGELPAEYAPHKKEFLGAKCTYLNVSDWDPEGSLLLWDQIKYCGINDDWDDVDEGF